MNCPRCNQQIRTIAKFCPTCGVDLSRYTRLCPTCGRQVRLQSIFCQYCGANLANAPSSPVQPLPQPVSTGGAPASGAQLPSGVVTSCPHCQTPAQVGARFCRNCGKALTRPCPVCQRPNRIQSVFCAHCGANLGSKKIEQTYDTGRLPPNSLLNERYLVIRKIAQGGMGAIYLGTDTHIPGTKLVIKEMSYAPLDALRVELRAETKRKLEESFQREFEILRDAQHTNLPRAYDFFVEKDRPYFVMEYIDGENLEKKLAALPAGEHFDDATVLNWAHQLCDVLDYLHHQHPPIIYRDLKPSNVMETSATRLIKLVDFGIARFYKPGKKGDTIRFGTYGYLAPEALSNAGQTNPVTDVYALGALLHQLLTNIDPSDNPMNFTPIRQVNSAVSARVERAVLRAVEPNPTRRPQSTREMIEELTGKKAAFANRKGQAPRPSVKPVPAPQPAKPPGAVKPARPPQPAPSPLIPVAAKPAAPPKPTPLAISTNMVNLGSLRRGAHQVAGRFTVTAQPNIAVQVISTDDWLRVEPAQFSGNGNAVEIHLLASAERLPYGNQRLGKTRRKPPLMLRPLFAYINTHLQLVPAAEAHTGELYIQGQGGSPHRVQVSLTIRPPEALVLLGWLLALGLILVEVTFLVLPVIFLIYMV